MDKTYQMVLQMQKEAGAGSTAVKKIAPNTAKAVAEIVKLFGPKGTKWLKKDYALPVAKGIGKDIVRPGSSLLKFLWDKKLRSIYYPMNVNEGRRVLNMKNILGTAGIGGIGAYAWLRPDKAKQSLADAGSAIKEKASEGMNKLYEWANDTRNGVPTRQIATTKFSLGGLGSTLNPVSGLTGGIDWVPKGYVDLVQKAVPGNDGASLAHTTFKAGAIGLLAAGLVGGYRAAQHVKDVVSMDKADRPGKDMASQLSTTFSGNMSGEEDEQKKAASIKTAEDTAIMSPGNLTAQNLTATAIPIGALLLSAGLAYKGVDSAFDKLRNKRLDKAIAEKDQAVKKLITARAQLAKGNVSMDAANAATDPLKDSDVYTKAASQNKEALIPQSVQLFGALTSAVILASAIGSYAYTSAGDENNLKYKAYKKALKEYAKNKSGITPITVAPKDAPSYFAAIDAAGQKQAPTVRQQPSYDADALNKPISISI